MSPENYSWIAAFATPVSTLLVTIIFFYGAFHSQFRLSFSVIGVAGVFLFLSEFYWLGATIQQTYGGSQLTFKAFRLLFPIQALCFYTGIAVSIAGDALLVYQAVREHNKTDRPPNNIS